MKRINIFTVIVAIVFCLITILIKQNNNNYNYQKSECSLPCIWGLTPGETTLLDLELILNNQEYIQISEYIELDNNYIHLEVNDIDSGTKAVIQVKNEIIEKIIITDGDNKLLDNKIDEFLIRNGSPNSILIEIASQQFNQWDITLSLIYSEKRFLATYNTHDYNIINNNIAIICFNQNPGLIVKDVN